MTREEAIKILKSKMDGHTDTSYEWAETVRMATKALEQEPCEDTISRKSIKQKLQEHHDFFVNAYGGYSNLPQNDKSRVDEITNCIAMVVNEPSVTPQEQRWIPVSEYLPVTNDEVLVTYIVNGNAKKRYVETANCYDGEWSSVNDEYRIPNTKIEIIAWCEMPKPYSEVKE